MIPFPQGEPPPSTAWEAGGVSFLPRFAVEDDIEKKKLTLLDVKDIEITMYRQIFYHKNKFKTKEMEKFAEFALADN